MPKDKAEDIPEIKRHCAGYIPIAKPTLADLQSAVREACDHGAIPFGGVSHVFTPGNPGEHQYIQPVVWQVEE